jgi:hypothetical protein
VDISSGRRGAMGGENLYKRSTNSILKNDKRSTNSI